MNTYCAEFHICKKLLNERCPDQRFSVICYFYGSVVLTFASAHVMFQSPVSYFIFYV